MSGYTMSVTLDRPYDEVLAHVRQAQSDQGFGVLTESDVRDTLRAKLGVDVPAQVILGACRPELAHRALCAAPSLAALVPCNVAVFGGREHGAGRGHRPCGDERIEDGDEGPGRRRRSPRPALSDAARGVHQ